uniref:Integrase catalytic domain-containing protein n=1 Tax=Tanacetum cinerariifolium TaxID=118510 RepID=A0A6L2MAK8_TANCI|nr:hypothetical protein [Tanacetum cinerariifolium]
MLFDNTMKWIEAFVPMDIELVKGSDKAVEGSEKAKEGSSKRAADNLEQEDAKRKMIEEENETAELKRCLEIIPEYDDDVTIEATPISSKSLTIVDYKIYKEGRKSFFKIIRAYGNSQSYLTFGKMFKNFKREDLEDLWSIIKARFKKTKPVDDMDNLLFQTLKTMFEHHVQDNIWKYQQGTTKVLHWKLYYSCGVYCVTTQNMVYYLLVEKMYPFTRNFLHQMWNDVRLQVDYEVEMEYDLLRLIRRNMTWNMSYLSYFDEINGGYVAFGGNPKGGKITGKGKIRTGKLDFNDVNFVKELKLNLFSVSQMCDKKNNVLFTYTECIVLSSDFKLPDENHVLLRVPRENDMYNVDLKNIVPSRDLTCLFSKATLDESNLWHKRLGHINFKTIKKLVKGNLVRGLPSKVFENNHTCVSGKKGKQHRASWIKKEFSVAKIPQHNGIAEMKNRTLIEATRIMLADSFLPIPCWAEAVNTTCYVQNRVLVIKPHNKTPYELLLGRTPSIVFMRPFGCPVTILNTLDPLGKFDVKADEGFLVGYSNTDDDAIFQVKEPEFEVKEPESEVHVSPSSSATTKKHDDKTNKEDKGKIPAVGRNLTNSTNTFSAAGPFNTVVCPTTRVHKDHPVTQIIDPSWIEAIQEELLQFKMQKVWVLVDLPTGKRAIGSKWVFKNKKDERRIVVRNKARLVGQGHTQEEGIDYEEVFTPGTIKEEVYVCQPPGFKDPDYLDKVYKVVNVLYGLHQAPRAWYETLANYLLENGFQKGKIGQTLFIKKQKGLQVKQKQNGIFISQDKYVAEVLRKFGLTDGKSASTPIDTEKPLLKDPDGEDVDIHTYSQEDF